MKVVDCHTHCFPDAIAEKAIAGLMEVYRFTPSFDGSVRGLIERMDACGIAASWNMPVATSPSQVRSINDWVAATRSERLVGFGAMHPDLPDPAAEIVRLAEIGVPGIKVQPNWQNCAVDDPRMLPIYEAAQGKLIVCFHAGEELDVWPHMLAPPAAIAWVHDTFPRLTIIGAHMGGFRMWDQVENHLLGRDIYLDISACLPKALSRDRFVQMVRAHGAHKILFGSDSPCCDPLPQIECLLGLPLSADEKDMIAWRNAERLVSKDAR